MDTDGRYDHWNIRRSEKDVIKVYDKLTPLMQLGAESNILNFGLWDKNTKDPAEAQKKMCEYIYDFGKFESSKNYRLSIVKASNRIKYYLESIISYFPLVLITLFDSIKNFPNGLKCCADSNATRVSNEHELIGIAVDVEFTKPRFLLVVSWFN